MKLPPPPRAPAPPLVRVATFPCRAGDCMGPRSHRPLCPPTACAQNTPAVHALVNARLVLSPGRTIDKGNVIIRDGAIVAVGASADVAPPADARVWDLTGKTVYAGLIDAYGEAGDAGARRTSRGGASGDGSTAASAAAGAELMRPVSGGALYWNSRVTPQARADQQYRPDAEANKKLRSQGIVARLVAPSRQVIKGTSTAVTTGDADGYARHPAADGRDAPPVDTRRPVRAGVPGLADGRLCAGAAGDVRRAVVRQGPRRVGGRPLAAAAGAQRRSLEALQPVLSGCLPVVIDAADEQYVMCADRLAKEFKLNALVRGSGQEYRRIDEIAATGRQILVPVNFGKPPNVASPSRLDYSLEELMDWDLQPENPCRSGPASRSH